MICCLNTAIEYKNIVEGKIGHKPKMNLTCKYEIWTHLMKNIPNNIDAAGPIGHTPKKNRTYKYEIDESAEEHTI